MTMRALRAACGCERIFCPQVCARTNRRSMSVKKYLFVLPVITSLLLLALAVGHFTPARVAFARRQSAPSASDLPVINATQSDPRDETTVAVSRTNAQVIVGASKWIEGGGGASKNGNTR